MNFKKLTAMLLGLAMTFSLTACGDKDPKPTETTPATEVVETTEATEVTEDVETVDLVGTAWYGEDYVVLFMEDGSMQVTTPNGNASYYGDYTISGEYGEIRFLADDSEFSFSVEDNELFIFSLDDDDAAALFIGSEDEAVQNGMKAKEILTASTWTDGEYEYFFGLDNSFTMTGPDVGVYMSSYSWNLLTQEGVVNVDGMDVPFTLDEDGIDMDGTELVVADSSSTETGDLENVLWAHGDMVAFFLEDGTMVVANNKDFNVVTGTYTWDGSSGVGTPEGSDESCLLSLHDDGLYLEEEDEIVVFTPMSNSYSSEMDPDPLENMLYYTWMLEEDGESMMIELYSDGTLVAQLSTGDEAEGTYTWDGVSGTITLDGATAPLHFVGGFLLVNHVPMTPLD